MSKSNMNFGLYFHIPFCKKKCAYCDFLSFPISDFNVKQVDMYFEAIKKELYINKDNIRNVDSIFIGGGTPSIVSPTYIFELLNYVKSNINIKENAEITIEVNPGTVTREHFNLYKKSGINRISIGVQSTHNRLLNSLGRIHNFNDVINTIHEAQNAGFENINCDLIFAVPKILNNPAQTINELKSDINNLISLNIKHISAYSLILEEKTLFYDYYENNKISFIDDLSERDMYYLLQNDLKLYNFYQYEISNFALKGYECKHNKKYWECVPYMGFGMGAASYYPDIKSKDYIRRSNISTYEEFINFDFVYEKEKIDIIEQMNEFMMLGFRKISGPERKTFYDRFGHDYTDVFKDKLKYLENKGLICIENNVHLTQKGLDFANEVCREFV